MLIRKLLRRRRCAIRSMHCVGLTDLVTEQDGSSMAAGFMQWDNAFFPWTLNYDEIDMVL
ncbi:hypothetical protein MJH54_30655, partial [Salmonella enterica subsp. enterica serovar Montevideo]|nr:hypothetical protein [Salmonella enterica subsp. enterica serovar Montevideo]